jgi:D-3-phosphoglycerate dehydrogenase / 2-oxoglutarate reductase
MKKEFSNIKVVYTSVPPIAIESEGFKKLGIKYIEKPCYTEEEIISICDDAYAAIIRSEPCTRKVISSLKECRLIMTPKVGFDNIDVSAANEMGICVANMRGLSVDEVSDHAMALLLACSRKLLILDKTLRDGEWEVFHGKEIQARWKGISLLSGQTLGLIGFGTISRNIVPKAKAFGLNILATDPYVPNKIMEELGVQSVSLEVLLEESDFVSIHTPLSKLTYHMLGIDQFKSMKPTAYVINTSRGAVIDEKAIYIALTKGYIAGAGLDVLEVEPIETNNPLLMLDNVILTGHSAHYSDQVWREQAKRPFEEIERLLLGKWPLGWVNPEVEAKYNERWHQGS